MTRPMSHLPALGLASCILLAAASFADGDEPKQQDSTTAATEAAIESLDVQLAKARVNLAKMELERALAENKRIPGSWPEITLELLHRNVDVAQARLDGLSRSGEASLHTAHLQELESALKIAELRWNGAVHLRERLPSAIDASRVEALHLRAEVARLELARARNPAHVSTPLDHVRWQLEQMRQELLELTVRVEKLSNN